MRCGSGAGSVIDQATFLAELNQLCELLPIHKRFRPESLVAAWDLLPSAAKEHLTPDTLGYAVRQRLLDPAPPDQALHLALLRYVFPLDDGAPDCSGGLRQDLPLRLANPDRFHDPTRRLEPVRAKFLPGGEKTWHPSQMSDEERRECLQKAISDLERMKSAGTSGAPLRPSEAAMGERLFAAVVAGFTPLDAKTLGASWAVRNYESAIGQLHDALAITAPVLPTSNRAVAGMIGYYPQPDPGEDSPTFEDEIGL